MYRQVACFSQLSPRVNNATISLAETLALRVFTITDLYTGVCGRKRSVVCTRQNPGNLFWDGPWSRVIHFQEEVQVLIACSDRDNRFYRASNAVGGCSWRCSRHTVLSLTAVPKGSSLPLFPAGKRKETTEERA